MTYKVKMTTTFKKSYKRCQKRGMDMKLLDEIIDISMHINKKLN